MTKLFYTLASILIFLSACTNHSSSAADEDAPPITIVLQPFDDIDKNKVDAALESIQKHYPYVSVNKSIPLPKIAYTKARNRYRADILINFLKSKAAPNQVLIGLTTKDISTTKDLIDDYGIMGLGYQPGSACVISSFRISKTNTLEQFAKLALHELGHTQGLPHCAISFCYMRDAEGKNHLDEENRFCPACQEHLTQRGWH